MKKQNLATLHDLNTWVNYDKDTGLFTRKKSANRRFKIGEQPGTISSTGYVVIKIQDISYKAHRLAWLFSYGEWPALDLDHINRIKTDNRLSNLRQATPTQNNSNVTARANNKSGYKGVIYCARNNNWQAYCGLNKKKHHLGCFDTALEASAAYLAFAKKEQREFFTNL